MQADHINHEVKGLKKSFDNGAKVSINKYFSLPIFSMEGTNEWNEKFTSTMGFSGARELTENETPDINALGEGQAITLSTKRFGNAFQITTTDVEKMSDGTIKVETFFTRQRNQALYDLNYLLLNNLHDFFNYAFDTTKYAAPDTKALCADDHEWEAGGVTFDNKATDIFDETAVDDALTAGSNITDSAGKVMGVSYDTIVVAKHSAAAKAAKKQFAEHIVPTQIGNINIYEGEMRVIELPLFETAKKVYWFLFDTSKGASPLYVGIKKYPALADPIIQNNGSYRVNIEGFWKQGINNMPYAMRGSTGAS